MSWVRLAIVAARLAWEAWREHRRQQAEQSRVVAQAAGEAAKRSEVK